MLRSIDPYRQHVVAKYDNDNSELIVQKIVKADRAFSKWKVLSVPERLEGLERLKAILDERKLDFAQLMAIEMGKPIAQGLAEIEKCISLCQHYIENADDYLATIHKEKDEVITQVRRRPFGVWLGIMPWNFPFWQVFRYAIPALIAGNTILLKHSQYTTGCALKIQEAIDAAWYNEHLFQVLLIASHQVDEVISHPAVAGVSLTGSESAGRSVAALAGRNIKMSILELGGSNAMIVDEHADLLEVIEGIVQGRLLNSGQSCIAAKRILVHESRWHEVQLAITERIKNLKSGDPLEQDTFIGPLVNLDAAEQIEKQYQRGIQQGAEVIVPLQRSGAMVLPGIVLLNNAQNVLWHEETFGPLVVFMKWQDMKECLKLRAHDQYALGTCIYTADPEKWIKRIHHIQEPMIVFNNIVKSAPHLPFGGIKKSGYGTELGKEGILSFTYPQVILL